MKSCEKAWEILGRNLMHEIEQNGLVVVSKEDAELINHYKDLSDEEETRC